MTASLFSSLWQRHRNPGPTEQNAFPPAGSPPSLPPIDGHRSNQGDGAQSPSHDGRASTFLTVKPLT